ncbi:hypothetical protein KIPB_007259 [Kipferlia bialata]|uniref:Helicase-associated domain-containing protein n=1 Tax=Kipferlia bialata TaxID=797122 RepID=A0A9K3D0V4_9EUKA|nr:hypothetical protein KIPB_007259 [Kipferlia bialata]|eukprot:g7259.t1
MHRKENQSGNMDSGGEHVKQEPPLWQLASSAQRVKHEPGIVTDTEGVDKGHADTGLQLQEHRPDRHPTQQPLQSDQSVLRMFHTSLLAESAALRQRHQELTDRLQCERAHFDTRLASLAQSLTDQEREHKAKAKRQEEVYEGRIASLSQSLAEQEQVTERLREVYTSRDESLSLQLSHCQSDCVGLFHSLKRSQTTCGRLAKEVIEGRVHKAEREKKERHMELQILELQADVSRLTAQEAHGSPRPPQRKRVAPKVPMRDLATMPLNAETRGCVERDLQIGLEADAELSESCSSRHDLAHDESPCQCADGIQGAASESDALMEGESEKSAWEETESESGSEDEDGAAVASPRVPRDPPTDSTPLGHGLLTHGESRTADRGPTHKTALPSLDTRIECQSSDIVASGQRVHIYPGTSRDNTTSVVGGRWGLRLAELKTHLATYNSWPTRASQRSLGVWVESQRQHHRGGTLHRDRITALEDVGIVWNPGNSDALFATRLAELQQYLHTHRGWPPIRQGSLGEWLMHQRHKRRNGTLSADREAALDRLGIDWDPTSHIPTWDTMLRQLTRYLQCNERWPGSREGSLGRWVGRQKVSYRNKKLSGVRTAALESLGIIWNPRNSAKH